MFAVWIALGVAIGAVHSASLWWSAHHWAPSSIAVVCRLPIVAVVLIACMTGGAALPAIGGWASGLAAMSAFLCLRCDP
jgi:hypothetical protein